MAPVAAARAPTGAAVTVGPCGQLIDDDDIVNNRWAAHSTEAAAVAAQSIQPITISAIFPYCFASVLLFTFLFFTILLGLLLWWCSCSFSFRGLFSSDQWPYRDSLRDSSKRIFVFRFK